MAWPSDSDIDITKLDNDNDKISDSRAELYKMAGYVNDIIDNGPGGLTSDEIAVGDPTSATTVTIGVSGDGKSLQLYGGNVDDSAGADLGPSISLGPNENSNIALFTRLGGSLQLPVNNTQATTPGGFGNSVAGYWKVNDPVLGIVYIKLWQ